MLVTRAQEEKGEWIEFTVKGEVFKVTAKIKRGQSYLVIDANKEKVKVRRVKHEVN